MNSYDTKDGYFLNCLDPGGDTGMALLYVGSMRFELLESATVQWRPDRNETPVTTLRDWLQKYPGPHDLLYESFVLRNTSSAAGTDLTALEVIESIGQLSRNGGPYREVFSQQPVGGKFMATDEVLEKLGLHFDHKRNQRHVRDALRHGVTHLAKRRYVPVCIAAFPRRSVRIPPDSRP